MGLSEAGSGDTGFTREKMENRDNLDERLKAERAFGQALCLGLGWALFGPCRGLEEPREDEGVLVLTSP